jgi:hypothetical protein
MTESAMWVTVASTAVGSVSALGGVYLNGLFSKNVRAEDRKHDAASSRNTLLRNEGEILYRAVNAYCSASYAVLVNYSFWIDEKMNGQYCIENNSTDHEKKMAVDLGKLKFIMQCYFPQLEDEWSELGAHISYLNDVTTSFKVLGTDYTGGRPNSEAVQKFKNEMVKMHNMRIDMLASIAAEVRKLDHPS